MGAVVATGTKRDHEQAMDLLEESVGKQRQALGLEIGCVKRLEEEHRQYSLDYAVLCRSAATIAVNLGCCDAAYQLCKKGLQGAGNYPEIEMELLDVLARIAFMRGLGR